jgi:hypothetical protein
MRAKSLKEDFENRVAINDLNNPEVVKSAILRELKNKYNLEDTTDVEKNLGDVMFDLRSLDVELHNGPMYEITDLLDVSNAELASLIKDVLSTMDKSLFESILITGKVKMFEQFHQK